MFFVAVIGVCFNKGDYVSTECSWWSYLVISACKWIGEIWSTCLIKVLQVVLYFPSVPHWKVVFCIKMSLIWIPGSWRMPCIYRLLLETLLVLTQVFFCSALGVSSNFSATVTEIPFYMKLYFGRSFNEDLFKCKTQFSWIRAICTMYCTSYTIVLP